MNIQLQQKSSIQPQQLQQQSVQLVPRSINDICPYKNNPHTSSTSYRADIDGLRTIAITLVLIYHAWPKSLPGGFIGVDIFFVISGYLITQIIIKQTLKDRFSYVDFYSRRVKRIYPALLLVLIFTLFIAVKYSQKNQAELTFNTLEASTVFGANIQILFYNQGYFDPDIRLNPLLHLWSLGVEEQFYIFWPCLLAIVLKKWKNQTLLVLGAYATVSFVFAIVAVFNNMKLAFYFPVCRFWQMAVGGILAYLGINIQNKTVNNALSCGALVAILVSVFVISDKSLFPGFWALIPTFSSAFIIQAKNEAFINKHILSSKIFVWIGKISYSLYLWHWPLLVFSKTFYPPGSTSIFANTFFIVFLTFVLTILTYFIAEDPIRKMKGSKIVIILLILMISLGITTLIINVKIIPQLQKQKQEYTVWYLKQAQKQMMPGPDDLVQKSGKKYPNLSVNKNRTKQTTVQKVRTPRTDQQWDHQHAKGKQLQEILEKNIDQSSIYYKANRPQLDFYAVANQGKQKMVLLIGDSHALKLSYRFQQLYRDSVRQKRQDKFPTIVAIIHYDPKDRMKYHKQMMDFSLEFTKQHKPQRVMVVNHWFNRFCEDHDLSLFEPADCHTQRIDPYVQYLANYIKQFQKLNIEVTLNAFDIQNHQLHPYNMIDFNGVIQENIQPFRSSDFQRKYQTVIEQFEKGIQELNVKVIDLSDHLCWQDVCEVLSPSGHAVYVDNNHYSKFYVRHWFTSIDHLTKF